MLIIMAGLPGTGKSTVAKQLAKKINGVVLRSDVVRKELFARPTYSAKETDEVYVELFDRARSALPSPVILDATFSERRHRKAAQKEALALKIPFTIVLTDAPESVVRERIAMRANDPSDATFVNYLEKKAAFEPLEELHFRIDTSEELESQIDQILDSM